MAKRLNMAFLVVIAAAALLQSSVAQTTYEVGDALGWTIPPNGAVAYSVWAANKTFTVGNVLVFNFTTGQHDVAQVTKADYDACNGASPIFFQTNGPVSVTLNETGEHYYICTIGSHCTLGQKLAINVTAATSPAPQPSTPPPATTPTPAPAVAPTPSTPSPVLAPAPAPSTATPPPSTTPPSPATPPSSTATPPPSTTPPPPSPATPPSSTTTPPPLTPSSTPSPTGVVAPPPPPNSATSLRIGGLCATFLSIVVTLLY